jgi:hypothetical protein
MKLKILFFIFLTQQLSQIISAQDTISGSHDEWKDKTTSIYGFIRGGAYYDLDRKSDEPFLSSGFSDIGLKAESEYAGKYKAFADVRFRFGSEFNKPVDYFNIHEAYVILNEKNLDFAIGQKILKWGRADFTNPTSKFNPQNMISRSTDPGDMDLGNILAIINWYPAGKISMQAVFAPYYRPSVLIIDPVPLPENTTIDQINGLITNQELSSYGFRTDFHFKGIDCGVSWFNGYDPMPGVSLTNFNIDLSGAIPVFKTELAIKPYKTQVFGIDFESVVSSFGLRGEFAWSLPSLSYKKNEYVPLEEVKWVTGLDWSPGSWRFTAEYTGKFLPRFEPSLVDPIIGTEPDYALFAEMLTIPGFNINDYIRQEVGSFNRLFNYQIKKCYHSAGIKIERDLNYGIITPSLFTMFNFTSSDLLIIPEIIYKPADGFTIVAGAEYFHGKKGSLFDIVDDFMNTIYFTIKVDF